MRTTINISNGHLEKLKNSADILSISTHDLIALLIKTVISKNIFEFNIFNGIKYQDIDSKKNWQKFHVRFQPQVYEKGLDLRKCFKLSVSFIISYAIIHLLDELEKELLNPKNAIKIVDNYPSNYIFMPKDYDGIQGFIVLWGIPEEKYLKTLII